MASIRTRVINGETFFSAIDIIKSLKRNAHIASTVHSRLKGQLQGTGYHAIDMKLHGHSRRTPMVRRKAALLLAKKTPNQVFGALPGVERFIRTKNTSAQQQRASPGSPFAVRVPQTTNTPSARALASHGPALVRVPRTEPAADVLSRMEKDGKVALRRIELYKEMMTAMGIDCMNDADARAALHRFGRQEMARLDLSPTQNCLSHNTR